jgi:hypothetical protein
MRHLVVVGSALLALACGGGGKNVRASGGRDQTPSWLSEGTGAVRSEGGKRLQGVGVASGIADPKARRKQADAAAREQLQGAVDALARTLAKMSEAGQQGLVETTMSLARKAASQSAAIRDHWVTPDGDERAVAVLELDALRRSLQSGEGDDRVRGEMAANVDRAFDQLAASGVR